MTSPTREMLNKLRDELSVKGYGHKDVVDFRFKSGFSACADLLWPLVSSVIKWKAAAKSNKESQVHEYEHWALECDKAWTDLEEALYTLSAKLGGKGG